MSSIYDCEKNNNRKIITFAKQNGENMSKLTEDIVKLKKKRNAVILAHYYVGDEVQEIADYIGDSYYLSKVAKELEEDVIVFAGVSFMGESAKLLNPKKLVLMPDMNADCAMAHMVKLEKIQEMREKYEDLAVVCYINSTAEIKTYADVCVTSANAVKIVKNLPNKNIFFIPDGNLGRYVAEQVSEKNIILNDGFCPVHAAQTREDVLKAKCEHPNAEFVVHPECIKELLDEASYIGSTSGIIDYVSASECEEFIIGTEDGVFYELKKRNPNKKFYKLNDKFVCRDMKLVTLENIKKVLETLENQVEVDEAVREKALRPLENMLKYAK